MSRIICLAVLAATAWHACAETRTHVLEPVVALRTTEGGVLTGEAAGQVADGTKDNVTWLRFEIPEFDGERIVRATLDVGPLAQLNPPWHAGVTLSRVTTDDWSAESLAVGPPPTEEPVYNRQASDTGGTPADRLSTEITDWLVPTDEGRVRFLSVRLGHSGGGTRGWWPQQATTLTVTTQVLATFPPPAPDRVPRSGLAVHGSLETIFPHEPPAVQDAPFVRLSAAGRESESAQIVVVAGPESLEVTEVSTSPLSSGERSLPADALKVELVGYVNIRTPSWRGWSRAGLWPDVLMPMRPFHVPAGQCRLVWVTVTPPAHTPAGAYHGAVTVHYASGATATVPVELTVRGYSLPRTPSFESSYWTNVGWVYPGGIRDWDTARKLFDLFSAYRTSTCTFAGITWWREADGRITCDWEQTRRNMEYAISVAGFCTINVSLGCHGLSPFSPPPPVLDRATGLPLAEDERKEVDVNFGALYLNEVCDWLEEKGWLEQAYIQLWDEPQRKDWTRVQSAYLAVRAWEPRLRLLCVAGVHPDKQGLFDIWVPHVAFHDRETYRMVREGVSLRVPMQPAARVTASSSGTGGGAFYQYAPLDAYDGCEYTKWTPAAEPTEAEPQWLRFDFEEPVELDGILVLPYGPAPAGPPPVELSGDGQEFSAAALLPVEDEANRWSFPRQAVKSVRLMFRLLPAPFEPTDMQPVPGPEKWGAGVRLVRFFGPDLPTGPLPRETGLRTSTLWEYNVGADWPSVNIDAAPGEIRATAWQCWSRGVTGYLNFGGAQWRFCRVISPFDLPALRSEEPPMIWDVPGNGACNIIWPGRDGPLASIRFARFRDGLDDVDALALLAERSPDHPLLRSLRQAGHGAYGSAGAIQLSRAAVCAALEEVMGE